MKHHEREQQRNGEVEGGGRQGHATLGGLPDEPRGRADADEQAAHRQRPRPPGSGSERRPEEQCPDGRARDYGKLYRLMCRCTPWLPAGSTETSAVPSRRGVPARRSAAVRAVKSSATSDSATIPSVPPTSAAGTTSSAPRPTASIVRGPSFIATSGKPKSAWKRPAVCLTSCAPTTRRLRPSGEAGPGSSPGGGVASSTRTPQHARGWRNAIWPARPARGAVSISSAPRSFSVTSAPPTSGVSKQR